MHRYWLALVLGAAAFAHCLGMCGGFVLHLSAGRSRLGVCGRQLVWHLGRITTYAFLGAFAGLGGRAMLTATSKTAQDVFSYVLGGLMVLCGLVMLGVIPTLVRGRRVQTPRLTTARSDAPLPAEFPQGPESTPDGIIASIFRQFFAQPSGGGALALGIATGFLPCPIVIGGLAIAADSGSVRDGIICMLAMGVGTIWSLLLLAMVGQVISMKFRRKAAIVAACILILAGLVTAFRGNDAIHRLLGGGHSCCHQAATAHMHHPSWSLCSCQSTIDNRQSAMDNL
jgi:sulfite exporter TauE/SafE